LFSNVEIKRIREFLIDKNMFKNKILNKYIKILTVCVFVILIAVQSSKSFVLDEMDFPALAHAISQTYRPIFYHGEVNAHELGTFHPTLYANSLALFIRIFGYSEISVRFFGVICTLLSAYLLILIFRQLIKKRNEVAETLFLGLYLLNPYTIASTTLPDIDSTIMPVVILLFIYVSLKYLLQKKDMSNKAVWILGALFGLTLWSKLTTPLIIPFLLACLAIITSKNYKKSLLFTLKVTLIGALGFILTYYLYCRLVNVSTTYTYHFLVASFTKGTKTKGYLAGAIDNLKYVRSFVYWPTIPIVGLLGISFLGVMFDKNKDEKTRIKKLLVLTSLLITLFYVALIAPFGGFFKYPFPVFGLGILTIIFFYDRYLKSVRISIILAFIAATLGFFIEKHFWKDSMFLNGKPFAGLTILAIIIIVSFVLLKVNTWRIAASIFVLAIFFAIGFQLSISRVQAISTYSTKYDYGKQGMDQTEAYLRSVTTPNEVIWSMKDIGYYVNDRYIESYGYYFDPALQNNLIRLLKAGKVRYYVVSTGIGEDNVDDYPNVKPILDTYAVPVKQFGNSIIYKSKA